MRMQQGFRWSMSYFYKPASNQLDKVTDAAADAAPGDYSKYNDIKQGQGDNNYHTMLSVI